MVGDNENIEFLKDLMVKRVVREHDVFIPDLLAGRLVHVRTLGRADLVALLRDETGIAPDDRRSFYGADLVVEARNAEGAVCHVAVEASYTADRRDSDRALRNAGYLTRCTGRPAIAVVASLHNDDHVQVLVDRGSIHWYALDKEDLKGGLYNNY